MQNSDTPNDLVRQELSARLDTLARDRSRLRREKEDAEKALRKANEAEVLNEERIVQFLAARFSLEPEEAFSDSLGYRVLNREFWDLPKGTVLRILFWNPGRPAAEWLVTDDPTLPTLQASGSLYGADWDLITVLNDLNLAHWVSAHETEEYTK